MIYLFKRLLVLQQRQVRHFLHNRNKSDQAKDEAWPLPDWNCQSGIQLTQCWLKKIYKPDDILNNLKRNDKPKNFFLCFDIHLELVFGKG